MFLEEGDEFVFEGPLGVVLLLIIDVGDGGGYLGNAHAEGPVSLLPGKAWPQPELVVDPFRGDAFDGLDGLGQVGGGWECQENVNVVPNPANCQCGKASVFGDAGDKWIEASLNRLRDQRQSLLRAKDAVDAVADV